VRTDDRLNEMPMAPVACRNCGANVLARKSSWNQTTVQWSAGATARCAERLDAERIPGHRIFLVCSALRESIEAAVAAGELKIVDGK
jgi:hypothetical protein